MSSSKSLTPQDCFNCCKVNTINNISQEMSDVFDGDFVIQWRGKWGEERGAARGSALDAGNKSRKAATSWSQSRLTPELKYVRCWVGASLKIDIKIAVDTGFTSFFFFRQQCCRLLDGTEGFFKGGSDRIKSDPRRIFFLRSLIFKSSIV